MPEKPPPPNLVPMPCPAYLVAAHKEGEDWKAVSYLVLFAQQDGDSARFLLYHPHFSGLVPADQVGEHYPSTLLIDPADEELFQAAQAVRARAVAAEASRRKGKGRQDRDEPTGENGRLGH